MANIRAAFPGHPLSQRQDIALALDHHHSAEGRPDYLGIGQYTPQRPVHPSVGVQIGAGQHKTSCRHVGLAMVE
jgi:hypothetical protein